MLGAFALLQEAGYRLPEGAGSSVSIIGSLIVGQSAVDARVVSPIAVIVVAISGIAGYTLPDRSLEAALRLWRFLLVLCALCLGIYGVMGGFLLLLWQLCGMENQGVSYLYPLCDGERRYRNTFLRMPLRRKRP
ncbi:MAG: spore germination protein [Clostridiales bacterium]|nr:spore germination protein [Candidatus Apopatocola equi]